MEEKGRVKQEMVFSGLRVGASVVSDVQVPEKCREICRRDIGRESGSQRI